MVTYNQRAGAGARRGASVQRSATGAARLCSDRRPPLGGRTRLVVIIIFIIMVLVHVHVLVVLV